MRLNGKSQRMSKAITPMPCNARNSSDSSDSSVQSLAGPQEASPSGFCGSNSERSEHQNKTFRHWDEAKRWSMRWFMVWILQCKTWPLQLLHFQEQILNLDSREFFWQSQDTAEKGLSTEANLQTVRTTLDCSKLWIWVSTMSFTPLIASLHWHAWYTLMY